MPGPLGSCKGVCVWLAQEEGKLHSPGWYMADPAFPPCRPRQGLAEEEGSYAQACESSTPSLWGLQGSGLGSLPCCPLYRLPGLGPQEDAAGGLRGAAQHSAEAHPATASRLRPHPRRSARGWGGDHIPGAPRWLFRGAISPPFNAVTSSLISMLEGNGPLALMMVRCC